MAKKDITKIVGFQSGHDVSYCILENGIPSVHEEWERLIRSKMEYGNGLKLFFERNVDSEDIKYFTFGNLGAIESKRYRRVCRDEESDAKMHKIISQNNGEFFEFGHHLSHGANAFYTSDFDKSLIISVDGFGEEEGHVQTTLTIDEGVGNKIKRVRIFEPEKVPIGRIYNHATKWIFGLSVGPPKGDQAGTVMAMATLGKPIHEDLFSDYDHNWPKLRKIAKLSEDEKFNVAASLQKFSENLFKFHIAKYIVGSGHDRICFSGGVSLNCVMIGKIQEWFPQIKDVFCDPVPYDAGLSLGSARYLWHHVLDNPRIKNSAKNMTPYLGISYSKKDIQTALTGFSDKLVSKNVSDQDVLQLLADQKIIAVFGGGSESGRRALGNRSILADPRNPDMKKVINEKVKHRQWFRPVAPSIIDEKISAWFENPLKSPYMSLALKVKKEKQDKIPAVVHFDGTARLQTVNKEISPWFHQFIANWEKISGVPVIINTSFNDSEPIVETPEDALKCFLKTKIDYLYFFDYGILIEKKP